VDADLVRAACLEPDVEERVGAEELVDLEMRHRFARRVGVERTTRWVVTVAADRCVDPPAP
jgi:hypothetical protein